MLIGRASDGPDIHDDFSGSVALVLIGLMGLMIGIVGLYGINKGKRLLQALRAPGSVIGLTLFMIPAGAYWYIFRDLGRSVSIIARINSIIPGSFDQLHPWQFICTVAIGLTFTVFSLVLHFRDPLHVSARTA